MVSIIFFPEVPELIIRGSGDQGSAPVVQVTYKSRFKRKKNFKKLGQICLKGNGQYHFFSEAPKLMIRGSGD